MLHPEQQFVFAGRSTSVSPDTKTHPEHVAPCAVMISECKRLIKEKLLPEEEIATLLQKHWKVAVITKEEQQILDFKKRLKSTMPPGWKFENGDTFARLNEAGIKLI